MLADVVEVFFLFQQDELIVEVFLGFQFFFYGLAAFLDDEVFVAVKRRQHRGSQHIFLTFDEDAVFFPLVEFVRRRKQVGGQLGDGFVLVGNEKLVIGDATLVKGLVEEVENFLVDHIGKGEAIHL